MKPESLSKSVLERIKEQHITPKPRWEFLLKDYVIWIASVICIVIGAFAASMLIEIFRMDDIEVIKSVEQGEFTGKVTAIIVIWIIFLFCFLGIAYYNFIHTKKGYRFPISTVIAVILVIISAFGVVLYDKGVTMRILDATEPVMLKLPPIVRIAHPRALFPSHPEQGTLSGVVVGLRESGSLFLLDSNEMLWTVIVKEPKPQDQHNLPPLQARIRCIGKRINENTFEAFRILPWERRPRPLFLRSPF